MRYYSFLLFLFVSIFWGCSEPSNDLTEGEILYTIYYPEEDTNGLMFDMMPKEMNYTFTKHSTKSEISAAMGLFKSAYINNGQTKQFSQTVKMLNKKYQTTYVDDAFDRMNPRFANLSIVFSEEQDSIIGFLCHKASFSVGDNGKTYSIYYTDEIGGKNPNSGTPFFAIPGIMLKYTVENFGIIMEFTAEAIHKKKIDSNDFNIGKEYTVITPDELKNQIETIFQSVQ